MHRKQIVICNRLPSNDWNLALYKNHIKIREISLKFGMLAKVHHSYLRMRKETWFSLQNDPELIQDPRGNKGFSILGLSQIPSHNLRYRNRIKPPNFKRCDIYAAVSMKDKSCKGVARILLDLMSKLQLGFIHQQIPVINHSGMYIYTTAPPSEMRSDPTTNSENHSVISQLLWQQIQASAATEYIPYHFAPKRLFNSYHTDIQEERAEGI